MTKLSSIIILSFTDTFEITNGSKNIQLQERKLLINLSYH